MLFLTRVIKNENWGHWANTLVLGSGPTPYCNKGDFEKCYILGTKIIYILCVLHF